MSLLEFILAVIVVRYLYKILASPSSNLINDIKPFLIKQNQKYKELHDEFLLSVLDADGDISKIMEASDKVNSQFREIETEILEYNSSYKLKKRWIIFYSFVTFDLCNWFLLLYIYHLNSLFLFYHLF